MTEADLYGELYQDEDLVWLFDEVTKHKLHLIRRIMCPARRVPQFKLQEDVLHPLWFIVSLYDKDYPRWRRHNFQITIFGIRADINRLLQEERTAVETLKETMNRIAPKK